MSFHTLDLNFDGLPHAIAAYLVVDPEPTLVDPGPATTLDTLFERMEAVGVPPEELRHVVLTHIHLDHAGGVGELCRRLPKVTVHVHEDGAVHLVDPERLVASTRRTFQEMHDRLYGEVLPLSADRIEAWRPGEGWRHPVLRPIPTPGHIDHHLGWLREDDGTLWAGDALGLLPDPEGPVHPATPPPSVDLIAWRRTLDEIRGLGPERVAITHFGHYEDGRDKADRLEDGLAKLERRIRAQLERGPEAVRADSEVYEEEVRSAYAHVLPRKGVDRYFDIFAAARDYAGVQRAIEKGKA